MPGGSLRSPPLPVRHRRRIVRRHRCDHRRVLLAPALRATLVADLASLALAGCAGCGHRLGLGPVHPCAARCRLRRAPARAPPGAVLAALVRALLRSAPALRSAPRRALLSAPVRTAPPPPPAACYARLPAAPAAPSATQSPWRLPSAGFAGVDSPNVDAAGLAVPDRPGRPWVSHPTQHAAGVRHWRFWRALPGTCGASGRLLLVGESV